MRTFAKRVLCLLMTAAMLFGILPVLGSAASGTTLYLNPGPWNVDGAKFAVYYWNNSGSHWAAMSLNSEGKYEAVIPSGYSNIIFCRMDTTGNLDWDHKWNQTKDLTIPTNGNNYYTVTGWVSGDETALGELVIADPVYIAGYLATGNYVLAGSALQTPANYTINYQPGILSVVGKMPSRINEDMFGQGVQNPGYSGTMAALRSSIYAGNFGNSFTLGNDNPDAMTYAGLVSHEINALGKVVSADAGVLRISVDAMPRSEAISFDDLIFDSYDGETLPGIIVDELDIPDVMLGEELD